MNREEMNPKFLPTGSPQELAAFLRYRSEGHAHSPDIVVYAKPEQWAELAELLDELTALRASAAPSDGEMEHIRSALETLSDPHKIKVDSLGLDRLLKLIERMSDIAKTAILHLPATLPPDAGKAEPVEWRENAIRVADAVKAYFDDGPPLDGRHSNAAGGNAYELLRWAEEELRFLAQLPATDEAGRDSAVPSADRTTEAGGRK